MNAAVLALAPGETDQLTLAEWDRLLTADEVLFERPDHPLAERLREAGIVAAPFDDEAHRRRHLGEGAEATPTADGGRSGWLLVADPDSPRIAELAEAGADVLLGPADPPDALAAARGAYVTRRAARSVATLASVMARLRGPGGCPWDAQQTHDSLQVHLVEETYEVIEAIEAGDLGAPLEEELGDLLLQVVFHAQMAADDGRFDLAGLTDVLVAKLIRRHPHVFGDTVVDGAGEVVRNWEAIKAAEKASAPREDPGASDEDPGSEDPFAGIPRALPSLLAAHKMQKRAARFGFEADAAVARARLQEALGEKSPGVGALLFWTVALARASGVDPESALRRELRSFRASLGAPP